MRVASNLMPRTSIMLAGLMMLLPTVMSEGLELPLPDHITCVLSWFRAR